MTDLIIDISNNNGHVVWGQLAAPASGVKGVIAKASEGVGFTDSYFAGHRVQAKQRKIPFGAYHFARPDVSMTQQAHHFCDIVGKLERTDIRPTLDWELPTNLSTEQQVDKIHAFGAVVKKRLGTFPMFYSYTAYIISQNLPDTVGNGLWVANYGRDDGTPHPVPVPVPWKKIVLHQYSSKGHVPGIQGHVDLNEGKLRSILAHPWLARIPG